VKYTASIFRVQNRDSWLFQSVAICQTTWCYSSREWYWYLLL